MSKAKQKFDDSKRDVTDLLNFHSKLSGKRRGRRPTEVGILNRSAIIFCAAIWEAFIEDAVEEAVLHLGQHCANRSKLPNHLVSEIEKQAQNQIRSDPKKLWEFASKSLSDLVADNAKRVANTLPGTGKEFNTAKTKQVSVLVKESLGLQAVESTWRWKRMTAKSAQAKLDDYISIRGDIAHGNRFSVSKVTPENMLNHIERLVEKTDEAISNHMLRVTGLPL